MLVITVRDNESVELWVGDRFLGIVGWNPRKGHGGPKAITMTFALDKAVDIRRAKKGGGAGNAPAHATHPPSDVMARHGASPPPE